MSTETWLNLCEHERETLKFQMDTIKYFKQCTDHVQWMCLSEPNANTLSRSHQTCISVYLCVYDGCILFPKTQNANQI